MQFSSYDTQGYYDEMFEHDGRPRPHARLLLETVESLSDGQLLRYKRAAERMLLQMGITFNVYGDTAGTDRIFPFDLIPRIVPAAEWDRIERGLKQRVHALNAFIDDIYHDQKILRDLVIPSEVILSAVSYRKRCHGLNPPWRVWRHVTGTDLVRDRDGQYYVLGIHRAPAGGRSARGTAHSRHLQFGVLRAQLPGPTDGSATGGGPGPDKSLSGPRKRRAATSPCSSARRAAPWESWRAS